MSSTFEEIQFGGKVHSIAEDEFSATVTGDGTEGFIDKLYSDYVSEGQPANAKGWIRIRLKACFLSLSAPPKWIESRGQWPFSNGKPMVFIGQVDVGENEIARKALSPREVLYIFGCRIDAEDGWRMEYKVVSQSHDFGRNVVAVAHHESAMESLNPKEFQLRRKKSHPKT